MDAPRYPAQTVAPTRDDPVIAGNSASIGGPVGDHAAAPTGFWRPLRVLVLMAVGSFALGLVTKVPCISNNWTDPGRYTHLCYSDIPPLYSLRGFADNVFPYLTTPLPGQEQFEYPVLTGVFAGVANWFSLHGHNPGLGFYIANAVMLCACLVVLVIATALTVRRRPWDAAMVALAPGTILCATINWDLFAVALTAVGLALWARRHPAAAGVVLGLAAAAKFYPIILFGPLLILCFRARRMRAFWTAVAGAVVAWLAVNLPFMLINFDGWFRFYDFSSTRGEDFGSPWMFLTTVGLHVPDDMINLLATGLFLLLCVGIAVLGLKAKRRPRLASMCFLVIAAFLLTNKVYSPQYVLWLIPLAAMARPRWRDFMIWQAGEFVYYVAIWLYLAGLNGGKGLPIGWYVIAILIHIAATAYLAGMIIRDAINPAHDPVRTDAWPEDRDDPGGGVLDGAPDRNARPDQSPADDDAELAGAATS